MLSMRTRQLRIHSGKVEAGNTNQEVGETGNMQYHLLCMKPS